MKKGFDFLKNGSLLAILAVLFCTGICFLRIPDASTVGTVPVEATELYSQVAETMQLVNDYRSEYGAAPLSVDSGWTNIAMLRAYEMFARMDETHRRPNGTSVSALSDKCGIPSYVAVGEVCNIRNPFSGNTAAYAGFHDFLNSSAHASIIRAKDYSYIGIGIARLENGCHAWCYVLAAAPISNQPPAIYNDRTVIKQIEVNSDYAKLNVAPPVLFTYGQSDMVRVSLGKNALNQSATVPNSAVTFTSSNPDVVQVNQATGAYNVIGTGSVTITASLPNGIKGEYTGSVSPLNVRALDISIDGKATKDANGYSVPASSFVYTYKGTEIKPSITASMKNGKTLADGVDYAVSYSTTKNTGSGRITAAAMLTGKGKFTGTYQVNYCIDPEAGADTGLEGIQSVSISFQGGQQGSYVSESSSPVLNASAYPGSAAVSGFKWFCDTPGITLEPENNGKSCRVKAGSGFSGTVAVTVTSLDKASVSSTVKIRFTAGTEEDEDDTDLVVKVCTILVTMDQAVEAGGTVQAHAAAYPSNAENRAVTWSSSDPSVATVDNNGLVKGVSPGKASIIATAADSSGVRASRSIEVYAQLGMPSVSASNSRNGILVKWEASPYAEGYYVYRRSGNSKWKKVATVKGSTAASYTDKETKNGTLYYYTVRSFRGGTLSPYSKTGKPVYRLSGIKLSSISGKSGHKICVKWSRNTKATGYQIQYASNKDFRNAKTKTVKGGSKSSYTLSGLAKGKIYYVRVRAYYSGNNVKSYTSWIPYKSLKLK